MCVCVCVLTQQQSCTLQILSMRNTTQTASPMLLARFVSSQSFSGDMQLNASWHTLCLIHTLFVSMCVRNSKTLRKIYLDTIMRPQEGCTFNQVNIWHITPARPPARLPVSRSAKQKAGVFVSIVRDRLCPQDQIWMKQILIKAQKRSFVFHQYNDPYMLLLFYEWNSQRSSYTCVSAFVCAYERQVQKVPIMRQSAKWSILQFCVYVCTCVCLWGAPEVSNISRHAKLNILQIREVEGA